MPLVGFYCQDDAGNRAEVPLDHFDTCTHGKGGRPAHSPWMCKAIAKKEAADLRHSTFQATATGVLGCPRSTFIKTHFPFHADPRRLMLLTRGTLLHAAAADLWDPATYTTEATDPVRHTLHGKLGGYDISMLVDVMRRDLTEVADLKFPNDFSVRHRAKGPKDDYILQLNEARLLLAQQPWAIEAGYNPKTVKLTLWDHACTSTDPPVAVPIPHITEDSLLSAHPGGGGVTVSDNFEVIEWAMEQLAAAGPAPSKQDIERIAASLPLAGEQQFNCKKCLEYCEVEPLCSQLVRKFGRPSTGGPSAS